jgi:hypothetical protein
MVKVKVRMQKMLGFLEVCPKLIFFFFGDKTPQVACPIGEGLTLLGWFAPLVTFSVY